MPHPREGPDQAIRQREETEGHSRIGAKTGHEHLDRGGGIELVGELGRQAAGPRRIGLEAAAAHDRQEQRGLIPSQCRPEGEPGVGRLGVCAR